MVGRTFGGLVMSVAEGGEVKHEIIIVKRGHGDEEHGHHGGVWKIAFADFMTAMMCFFLVMWLINAANDQTKAAVASYFNPIKLTDRSTNRKGLQDVGEGPSDAGQTADDPQKAVTKEGQNGQGNAGNTPVVNVEKQEVQPQTPATADEKLFADPYAVLSEIAADTSVMQNVSEKGDGGVQKSGPATGAEGGQSYRDPFAPEFWSQQVATPIAEASAQRGKADESAKSGDGKAQAEQSAAKSSDTAHALEVAPLEPLAKGNTKADKAAVASEKVQEKAETGTDHDKLADASKSDDASKSGDAPKTADTSKPGDKEAEKQPDAATVKAAADVKAELAGAFNPGDKIAQGLSVVATAKGVEISITDQLDFGMFEIGSAVPRRELVLAMEKIGHILNGQKGKITIEGHTDARPYRSAVYDNWRLSSARAQSAYYMLTRGGVNEARVKEVAGFADREPKDKSDPLAAVNRRIAILLETDG
jgi:chemotaxis protein MotB